MKATKREKEISGLVDRNTEYSIDEAVVLVKKTSKTKFNESVDLAVKLGVDPKKSDQMIRGTVSLPNGIGKKVRVLVLTRPGGEQEAIDAGAEHVGLEEFLEKIKNGWTDIDVIIATPETMGEVGKLGKILGPRGLMPNPKSGTVTMEIGKAVKEVKAGKISFRVDKAGIVHAMIGKVGFDEAKLAENIRSFLATLNRLKPPTAKGLYMKGATLSSTMGPGIHLDKAEVGTIH